MARNGSSLWDEIPESLVVCNELLATRLVNTVNVTARKKIVSQSLFSIEQVEHYLSDS